MLQVKKPTVKRELGKVKGEVKGEVKDELLAAQELQESSSQEREVFDLDADEVDSVISVTVEEEAANEPTDTEVRDLRAAAAKAREIARRLHGVGMAAAARSPAAAAAPARVPDQFTLDPAAVLPPPAGPPPPMPPPAGGPPSQVLPSQ
jgi:hypothetical protein